MKSIIQYNLLFLLSAFMLLFASIMNGGRNSLAPMPLEVAASLTLFITLGWYSFKKQITKLQLFFLIYSLLVLLIYLIPIPVEIWQNLPGRSTYLGSITWLKSQGIEPYIALSIVPEKSLHALLAVLPLFAIFLAIISLTEKYHVTLMYMLFILAAVQATLGLLQFSAPNNETWAWMSQQMHYNRARGTYINSDHFAAMIVMLLPIAIGMLVNQVANLSLNKIDKSTPKLLFFSFIIILFLLAIIFSRSRAVIALSILAVLASTFTFFRHIGAKHATSITALFATLTIGIATSIGLVPVLNRFASDPAKDGRWTIFKHTIEGIKEFFPWGSGPGTFQELYRSFQPAEQPKFWNHAHNDYLELFFDIGIFAIPVILLFFVIYILGWWQLRKTPWSQTRFIKVGAGIGILLILLHSLVDFNFHTPANAILFCFLTAVFLKPYNKNAT